MRLDQNLFFVVAERVKGGRVETLPVRVGHNAADLFARSVTGKLLWKLLHV